MSRRVYLVTRQAVDVEEEPQGRLTGHPTMWSFPGEAATAMPLRLFDDRAAAEAYRDECERLARVGRCPFLLAGEGWDVWAATSLEPEQLDSRLWELNIMPPEEDDTDWAGWWHSTPMTDEQREAVWGLLDCVRLYSVVELEMEG
jgi:hypothetical protein